MSGEVALATEGTTLRMSTVAGSDDRVHVDQTFQLVSSSTDLTILVNPKQFERLAGLVSGDVLRLEIGRFERQENQGTNVIGFLRASSERVSVMMSLGREERRAVPSHPSLKSQESVPAEVHAEPVLTAQQT